MHSGPSRRVSWTPITSASAASIAATVSSIGFFSFAPPPQMLKLIAVNSVSSESSPQALSTPPAPTSTVTAAIAVQARFPMSRHLLRFTSGGARAATLSAAAID